MRTRARATRRALGTFSIAVLALASVSNGPASAAEKYVTSAPKASQSDLKMLRNQVHLDHIADLLSAIPDGSNSNSGLAGIEVDPHVNKLTVYWHGTVRPKVKDTLTDARTSGVQVDLKSGSYTERYLRAEAERLGRTYLNKKFENEVRLSYFKPESDGSGIEVGVTTSPNQSVSAAIPSLRRAMETTVTLDYAPAGQVHPSYRYADTPPFWGGSYMAAPDPADPNGGHACTTGFGVADDQTGQTAVLTAAHCGVHQWLNGANQVIGDTGVRVTQYDAELVLAAGGSYIWDGAYMGDPNQYPRAVAGWSSSYVGDYVCASGAYSGGICDIRVAGTGINLIIDGVQVLGLVQAEQQSHLAIEGGGDSGGPMFSLTGTGDKAIARGTITGHDINTLVPCRGITGRECSWRSYYPDISNELQALHVHVLTS